MWRLSNGQAMRDDVIGDQLATANTFSAPINLASLSAICC